MRLIKATVCAFVLLMLAGKASHADTFASSGYNIYELSVIWQLPTSIIIADDYDGKRRLFVINRSAADPAFMNQCMTVLSQGYALRGKPGHGDGSNWHLISAGLGGSGTYNPVNNMVTFTKLESCSVDND